MSNASKNVFNRKLTTAIALYISDCKLIRMVINNL